MHLLGFLGPKIGELQPGVRFKIKNDPFPGEDWSYEVREMRRGDQARTFQADVLARDAYSQTEETLSLQKTRWLGRARFVDEETGHKHRLRLIA